MTRIIYKGQKGFLVKELEKEEDVYFWVSEDKKTRVKYDETDEDFYIEELEPLEFAINTSGATLLMNGGEKYIAFKVEDWTPDSAVLIQMWNFISSLIEALFNEQSEDSVSFILSQIELIEYHLQNDFDFK